MPELKRTEVRFDLTGVVQSTDDRKLQPGQLVELVNTYRLKEGPGPLDKRNGFDRTTTSTFEDEHSFVSYTGPATAVEHGNDGLMWRDSLDYLWFRDEDSGAGYYRGIDSRAFPRQRRVTNLARRGRMHKPIAVLKGGEVWHFALSLTAQDGATVSGYQLTIMDATTGTVIQKTVEVSGDIGGTIGAFSTDGIAAAVDGFNNVWVFLIDNLNVGVIRAHKFAAGGSTVTPTETTFATVTGVDLVMIDAMTLTGASNQIAVVAIGTSGSGPTVISNYHALLDPATGQADASPAAVTQTQNGSTNASVVACCAGLSIAISTGANGFFYYSFFREKSAATDNIEAVRVKVQLSDLSVTSKTVLKDYTLSTSKTLALATMSGMLFSGNTEVWYSSYVLGTPTTWKADNPEPSAFIDEHVYNGTSTTTTTALRNAYVAGKPFQNGTVWYVLLGTDDGETTRAQRGYMLMRQDFYLTTTILDGVGAAIFHAGGLVQGIDATTFPYLYRARSPHIVSPLSIGGSKFVYPLLTEGVGDDSPEPMLITVDFAATYFSNAPNIVVGGIPKWAGREDSAHELSPMRFPHGTLSFTVGSGGSVATTNRMAIRYATRLANGDLLRSAPSTTQSISFTGATSYFLNVPNLRHMNAGPLPDSISGRVNTYIEIYGSVDGGTDLFLQKSVLNQPWNDDQSVVVKPSAFTATGESLDTVGGALEPAPLPPCRLATVHKNRTWLLATPDGEIWPSLEHRQGRGPEFNEALNFEWRKGTGEIQAVASLDDNTLAIAKIDAIALVTGNGPDGVGNGSFDVLTLEGKDGCSNPAAFVHAKLASGVEGIVFQRSADGRMCVLTTGGVQEIYQGMESYTGYVFTGSVNLKSKRQVRFYATNGKILVLDYGHPTQDQPWGQWVLYEGSGLPSAWIGARLINGEAVSMEAGTTTGLSWKDGSGWTDNGTSIARRFKTGKYQAPSGFMNEFDIDHFHVSTTRMGSGAVTHTVTFTDDQSNTDVHTYVDDANKDFTGRASVFRTREVQLEIAETTVNGERGRQFDGIVLEFCEYGRVQSPRRRIA